MKSTNLEKLGTYQLWADSIVRDIIKTLTEEEFTQEVGPPFGSVKNVCTHIVVAIEYNVESFIKKNEVNGEALYESLDNLSKDNLLSRWEEADNTLLTHIIQSNDNPIVFPNFVSGGELLIAPEDFFMQYIIHTAYHRGQLMSLLKMLGKKGETTDYLFYLFNAGAGSPG